MLWAALLVLKVSDTFYQVYVSGPFYILAEDIPGHKLSDLMTKNILKKANLINRKMSKEQV